MDIEIKAKIFYKKIAFIILILLIFIIFLFFNKLPPPRNLILISVDTLRADHMGIYGYEKNTTPNIDKWAKNALVFKNIYTILPLTLHSFYTLFTGREDILINEKMAFDMIPLKRLNNNSRQLLPEIFKARDFKTAAFITNYVLGKKYKEFFKRGFDEFSFVATGTRTDDDNDLFKYDDQNSVEITNQSINWLKRNNGEKFFLWIHYTTPHIPYNPSDMYVCAVDTNCQESISFLKEKRWDKEIYQCDPNTMISTNTIKAMESLYGGEIRSTDEQIGKVLDELKKTGLDKNSLVVFYGDHGEGFDHNMFGHGLTLYDSALHIPFIVAFPQSGRRGVDTSLVDNTSILPTILDLFDIKPQAKDIQGNSVARVFSFFGSIRPVKKEYLYAITSITGTNKFTIFNETYKYISSTKNQCLYKKQYEELYNRKVDPEENINLINNEKEKDLLKILKNKLKKKFEKMPKNYTKKKENNLENLEKIKGFKY